MLEEYSLYPHRQIRNKSFLILKLCEQNGSSDFQLILGTRNVTVIVSVLYYMLNDCTRLYKHSRSIEKG